MLDTITPEETYTAVVKEVIALTDADYASILLEKDQDLAHAFSSDPLIAKIAMKIDKLVNIAFKQNKLIIRNIDSGSTMIDDIKSKGILSIILIPLAYQGKSIGVLIVHSKKREHFTRKQVDTLKIFGSMASFAIKKSQMYNEAQKALLIRDMFISMAAHELRTPLTSISGYIQLLYSRLSKNEGQEGKWINSLYEENKRMMHLVKELLEVNRLRAGQLQFRWQECNLHSIIQEAINETQQRFSGRQINYKNTLKTESIIIGDRERLIKVFDNIVDNALKYSPKDESVDITLNNKLNFYTITVKDYGKGIDEKDLPNIFEGHLGGSGEEGMGIGLIFVENVIRQHRGSIQVKSKLKKGTTIEIKLQKARYM